VVLSLAQTPASYGLIEQELPAIEAGRVSPEQASA